MTEIPSKPSLFHRVAKNSIVVLGAKLIEICASMLVLMVLSRMFTLGRFGDFAWINSIVLAFQPLVNLELNTILIREMSRNRHREHALLGGGLLLKLLLIMVFIGSAIALDQVTTFQPVLRIAFFLAVAGEVFQQLTWVYSAVFMARERMEYEPVLTLAFRLTSVTGILLVAFFCPHDRMHDVGFVTVFFILAACQGFRAFIGMIIASRFLKEFRIRWSLTVAKELISQSWIMGIATFCTGLSLRVDVFFLKYFLGSDHVALFHLPHMFTLQVQILAVSAVTALFPVISRWGTDTREKQRFQMAQSVSIRFMMFIGLAIALTASLFPNLILRLLGGKGFHDASYALVILAWCIPVLFLNYLGANLLTAIKKQHLLIYGAASSLGINIVLDYLWVPTLGIRGAAIATVIAYSFQLAIVLGLLSVHSGNPIHWWNGLFLPLSITVGVGTGFWIVDGVLVESLVSGVLRLVAIGSVIMLLWLLIPENVKVMLRSGMGRPGVKIKPGNQ